MCMFSECWDENGKITDRSDIYSTGIVLLELFSAEKPWKGLLQQQIFKNVCSEKRHPPIPKAVPAEVAKLIEEMLSYESNTRPPATTVHERLVTVRRQLVPET